MPALIDCLPYTEEDMLELENEYAKETSNRIIFSLSIPQYYVI